jgi:hypothetical protein
MDDAMPPPRRQVPEIGCWICRGMFGPAIRLESASSVTAWFLIGRPTRNFSGRTRKIPHSKYLKRAAGGLQRVSEVRPWGRLFKRAAGFSALGVHFQVISS